MKIVKNKTKLKRATQPCESVEEGNKIAEKLIEVLDEIGGYGLAANQIGINKSVCVVRCREDFEDKILINPAIIEASDDRALYMEGCLSLPGKTTKTIRHKTVKVSCDNWENEIEFGPDGDLEEKTYWEDRGLLECVCVQHEIGHLNGELMTDPQFRYRKPIKPSIKHGRNEKVMIEKDGESKFVKFKHAEPLLADGWNII